MSIQLHLQDIPIVCIRKLRRRQEFHSWSIRIINGHDKRLGRCKGTSTKWDDVSPCVWMTRSNIGRRNKLMELMGTFTEAITCGKQTNWLTKTLEPKRTLLAMTSYFDSLYVCTLLKRALRLHKTSCSARLNTCTLEDFRWLQETRSACLSSGPQ